MSTRNYYPGINIYTQFGDLRPSQMLTLFSQFRQWPEYGESSFLASLENALLKLETANDEQNLEDGVTLPEEDDAEAPGQRQGGLSLRGQIPEYILLSTQCHCVIPISYNKA